MTQRKILALLFELTAENGRIGTLIAWPQDDGNGEFLKHSHPNRTHLEAKADDVVVYKRKHLLTVDRVRPYRTSAAKDDTAYSWITSGVEWENGEAA